MTEAASDILLVCLLFAGDRPYACQVCGKTFSESLTLTQVQLLFFFRAISIIAFRRPGRRIR